MKIQNKIIYILITIFLVYTLLFSVFIYYSISEYAFTDFYKRLEIRAITTAKIQLEQPHDVTTIKQLKQDYLEKLPQQTEYIIPVDAHGKWVPDATSNQFPISFLKEIGSNGHGSYNNENIYYSGIHYTTSDGHQYLVIISAENYFNTHHIAYLRNLLLTSLAYAVLLIVLFSFLFSRTLTKPLNNIVKEMRKISSENLHLRLDEPKNNDLLLKLIQTFNGMLNRLETSFETQKNFISNASHELNTPLTSIIGEADVALAKPRTNEEYRETLKVILEDAEKLDQKTKALLTLAQTGYDGKRQRFDKVRVDQLILDVKETVEHINPKNKLKLDFSFLPENPEKLKIKGNEQLIHLAVSNIVLNACKYSDNKPVNIAIGVDQKEVLILIKDRGIGIPEEDMPYIYDPFFRASNTKQYEGYGIGLPLALNIIRIHDGKLSIQSLEQQGTTVEIRLPIGNYSI